MMQTFFPATRLAYRLLARVLLVCAIFGICSSAIFGYLTYRSQTVAEQERLQAVAKTFAGPLAHDLWDLDLESAQHQLHAISTLLPSASIQLTLNDGKILTAGRPMNNKGFNYSLKLQHNNYDKNLGVLSVTLDPAIIRDNLRRRILFDAVVLPLFALVVALTLGFFVYHLVVRRLAILSRFASNLDLDALDRSTLHLPVPAKKQDELDDLLESVERMRRRISQDMLTARAMQRELRYQASHDPLTGLGNRSYLASRAQHLLSSANPNREIAFIFVDVDRFKLINDTLGHLVGDQLLRALSDRIRASLPPRAELFRPGSDEFLLLMPDPALSPTAQSVIQKLQESIAEPFEIDHHSLSVTVSIGVALAPEHGRELSNLLKHTDIALQAAKQSGRHNACFFTPDLLATLNDQIKIETLMRGALDRGEFSLVYQPQIDIQSGRVIGTEALLRWESKELGKVPPDRFIPVAEDTGLIVAIGAWVLREAIREWRRWRQMGLPPIRLSVNLSAVQLRHSDLFETIRAICQEEALAPEALELEVTESVLMDDVEVIAGKLATFRDMGIRIAVDDFGTGYSSLSYLKHLPIDQLKIDRSFIADLPGDPNDTAIAIAIIRMAQALNLEVIAEGVETQEQAALLLQEGCPLAQGYHYARPLAAAEFVAFLQATEAKNSASDLRMAAG